MEVGDGGGGWVPDTPGKVNLGRAEPIHGGIAFGGENGVILDDEEGLKSREGNGSGLCHNDPLASWNGIEFGDLLARADMGKTEPLMDFSSDGVRFSSSSFFVPGNGDVATVNVQRWASSRQVAQGRTAEEATEQTREQKSETGFAQGPAVNVGEPGESPEQVQVGAEMADLNATPQQKNKRRKHRPRVITEGKAKRSTSQAATESATKSSDTSVKRKYVQKKVIGDNQNSTVKRKYVRKKAVGDTQNSTGKRKYVRRKGLPNPSAESVKMAEPKGSKYTKKSCKKQLNFDSCSQANDERFQSETAPGAKANPIVLSDSDTDHELESSNASNSRNGKQQVRPNASNASNSKFGKQHVRLKAILKEKYLSLTTKSMHPSLRRVAKACYRSLRANQESSMNTPASVNLVDLVYPTAEEHSSTTFSTSLTSTSAIDNGKLAKEWWHCNPNAPSTMFQNSISKEEVADKGPAKDICAKTISSDDVTVTHTSSDHHTERAGESCVAVKPSKDQARLARRNRMQKRKHAINLLRLGVNMGRICNNSHSAYNPEAIWEYLISVEDIVEKLRNLDINRETETLRLHCNALIPFKTSYHEKYNLDSSRKQRGEQKELVLYKPDGTLIPFDVSQNRKRRPRAKVDLDEETGRVWRLLLENINSQGVDGTDEEKARWWENERNVFNGRANSFIARMHLVQGKVHSSPLGAVFYLRFTRTSVVCQNDSNA